MRFFKFLRHSPGGSSGPAVHGQMLFCTHWQNQRSSSVVEREFAQALPVQGVSVEECEDRTKQ